MDEVKRLRLEKGWSQNELAYHAKLAPSVISLIETGKRDPNATTLRKLAEALEVRIADLFEESGSGKAPRRSPSEPSFNDVLEEERRSEQLKYLRALRALVWNLEHRWKEEPPKTSREIAVVLDTMQALVDEGALEQPQDQITASDWRTASEGVELQALFLGLRRLNEIADAVGQDETAQERRELLKALPGGLSA